MKASKQMQVGNLKVEIHPSRQAAGEAAAQAAAETLRELAARHSPVAVIFATGASQLATLEALTAIPGLPWDQVVGFHMDEYLGIDPGHRASFRRYLHENLTAKARLREFHGIDGTRADPARTCTEYARLLRAHKPQLCLLGIGENGHLAFNDPAEAHFWDPEDVKVVSLDHTCRQQQVAEGWFGAVDEVPQQAITLTIPALLRVPKLIASVPGERKAAIVNRTLKERISTALPATILKVHADTTVYLDKESAAAIEAGVLR